MICSYRQPYQIYLKCLLLTVNGTVLYFLYIFSLFLIIKIFVYTFWQFMCLIPLFETFLQISTKCHTYISCIHDKQYCLSCMIIGFSACGFFGVFCLYMQSLLKYSGTIFYIQTNKNPANYHQICLDSLKKFLCSIIVLYYCSCIKYHAVLLVLNKSINTESNAFFYLE